MSSTSARSSDRFPGHDAPGQTPGETALHRPALTGCGNRPSSLSVVREPRSALATARFAAPSETYFHNSRLSRTPPADFVTSWRGLFHPDTVRVCPSFSPLTLHGQIWSSRGGLVELSFVGEFATMSLKMPDGKAMRDGQMFSARLNNVVTTERGVR